MDQAQTTAPKVEAAAHAGAAIDDRTMASWNPVAGSPDADLLDERGILVPRARDLARNNGIASGAIQTLQDNIIGSVLRLSAQPDYRALGKPKEWASDWARTTEAAFRSWADTKECDAGRSMTLIGLTTQALRGAFINGDAIAIPYWVPRKGSKWGTRLQVIEADRLETPPGRQDDANMRGGIEIDKHGAPVAYWIRKTHPGDFYGLLASLSRNGDFTRIPAFTPWGRPRVIHLHDKERSGQSRGKPLMAAVMREFRMAGHYSTTELQAAIANSLIAAFLESDMDQDSASRLFSSGKDGDPANYWNSAVGEYRASLKGGAIIPLPAGAKVSSHDPGRPNTAFDGFMSSVLRHIATGLNLPYELLLKDFSKTNYSSARAALMEAWRYFQGRRRWLKDYWLDPIYELWQEEAVNAGVIDAPDWYENRHPYTRNRWIFSGRGWIDPAKEAEAARRRLKAGLSTLEIECAEQGLDWEEVMEQRAREQETADSLGVSIDTESGTFRDEETNEREEAIP